MVRAGEVGAGDLIEVTHRPAHGVTIGETLRAFSGEPALMPRLLEAPELPSSVREKAARRLAGASI